MISADSYSDSPLLGSTRNGNCCLPPSFATFGRKRFPPCGVGRISASRSSSVSASRTRRQYGQASNSYSSRCFFGCCAAARALVPRQNRSVEVSVEFRTSIGSFIAALDHAGISGGPSGTAGDGAARQSFFSNAARSAKGAWVAPGFRSSPPRIGPDASRWRWCSLSWQYRHRSSQFVPSGGLWS